MKNTYAYQAYLIRLWQEEEQGEWRATLENPHTGERKGFANLDSLITYLRAKTNSSQPPSPAESIQPLD